MPKVTIQLFKGRTLDQKRAMVEKVTDAIAETVNARKEAIDITIIEVDKEDCAIGGKLYSDR
jgi:4-oxalocrotonate tautomerase